MRRHLLRSLTRRRDFEAVFREGINSSSKYLVVYAKPNGMEFNRIGLAVGKKIGMAVTRNRIRRLLKEAMRNVFADVPAHYDCVVIATRHTAEGTLDDFIRELKRFIKRLHNENTSDIAHQGI